MQNAVPVYMHAYGGVYTWVVLVVQASYAHRCTTYTWVAIYCSKKKGIPEKHNQLQGLLDPLRQRCLAARPHSGRRGGGGGGHAAPGLHCLSMRINFQQSLEFHLTKLLSSRIVASYPGFSEAGTSEN